MSNANYFKNAKKRKKIQTILLTISAILVAAIIIFPFVWIIPAAFKPRM